MSRRTYLYPLQDGFKVMMEVVQALPDDEESFFSWQRAGAAVAKIATSKDAVYLRMTFPYGPPTLSGETLLETDEVWITDEDRPEAERILAENCGSPQTQWMDLIYVSFTNEEEHRAFAAAYTRITGLPSYYHQDEVPTFLGTGSTG